MVLGERIRQIREMKKMTLRELARRANMNASYLSSIERGIRDNPSADLLKRIADALGVPVNVLISNAVIKDADTARIMEQLFQQVGESNMCLIPIIGTVRAGQPIFADQNIIGYDYIEKEKAAGGNLFELRVVGDSMDREGIKEGDFVIVKQQFDVDNGDIAVVLINGEEATIKRVYKVNGTLLLVPNSTNPEHKPVQINPLKTDIKILGKVIGLKRFF